jgi:hypothetical protein
LFALRFKTRRRVSAAAQTLSSRFDNEHAVLG